MITAFNLCALFGKDIFDRLFSYVCLTQENYLCGPDSKAAARPPSRIEAQTSLFTTSFLLQLHFKPVFLLLKFLQKLDWR